MDKENIEYLWVFVLGGFFSLMGWLNIRTKSDNFEEDKTSKRTKIQGVTRTFIGALLALTTYSAILEFYPSWNFMLQYSLSIASASFLGEEIIKIIGRKIKNV